MADTPRAFTGANAIAVCDGKPIAFMTQCEGGESISQFPIEVCGNIYPEGHEPVGVTTHFSAGLMQMLDTDPVKVGIMPGGTQAEVTGWPEMDILVKLASDPDKVAFKMIGCKPNSNTFSITARGLCQRNAGWVVRKMKEGSEA